MLPKLYTVNQTAEYFQVDARMIRKMIKGGDLIACEISAPGSGKTTLRIAESAIEACVAKRTKPADLGPIRGQSGSQKKSVARKPEKDSSGLSFSRNVLKRT